jgi:hypothetical protein
LHLLFAYAVAGYIRLGFGTWPRSCVDNPQLPSLDFLLPALVVGLLGTWLLVPLLWLGWFGLRLQRGLRKNLAWTAPLLVSGLIVEIAAQVMDPFNFWDWIWD